MQEQIDLNPCPCCGGVAEIEYISKNSKCVHVLCKKCWVTTGIYMAVHLAIHAWNSDYERGDVCKNK